MHLSMNSIANGLGQAQRLLGMLGRGQAESARQTSPGADGSPVSLTSATSMSSGGGSIANITLGGLMALQMQPPSTTDIATRLISGADGDQDGALSLAEVQTALGGNTSDSLNSAFAGIDANGDGKLSAEELTSALDAARHRGHLRPPPPQGTDVAARIMGAVDANGDGSATLEEITAALAGPRAGEAATRLTSAFSRLDANGDGKQTADEIATAFDAFIAAHHRSNQAAADTTTAATPVSTTA